MVLKSTLLYIQKCSKAGKKNKSNLSAVFKQVKGEANNNKNFEGGKMRSFKGLRGIIIIFKKLLSQRLRKHYYKTLGASEINSPISPPSMKFNTNLTRIVADFIVTILTGSKT